MIGNGAVRARSSLLSRWGMFKRVARYLVRGVCLIKAPSVHHCQRRTVPIGNQGAMNERSRSNGSCFVPNHPLTYGNYLGRRD